MGGIIQEAQQINALKDRKLFVEKHGTGSIRPVDMP